MATCLNNIKNIFNLHSNVQMYVTFNFQALTMIMINNKFDFSIHKKTNLT